MSKQPQVLWAQRSDKVYLTVSLPHAKGIMVNCEPEGFIELSAFAINGESCKFSLQLYGNVSPLKIGHQNLINKFFVLLLMEPTKGCEMTIGPRNIMCTLHKEQEGWWKRLLKSEEPAPYIKVDWKRWLYKEGEFFELNLASADDIVYAVENEESSNDKEMLSTSPMQKKRKIDESSPPEGRENQQGRCLVICFTRIYDDGLVFYTFESIPIDKLIHHSSTCMELESIKNHLFDWCNKNESSNSDTCDPCYSMSFLHIRDLIYVTGGMESFCSGALLSEFHCISLSGEVKAKCPMLDKKYLPLMIEMNGLFYVLSRPLPKYATSSIIANPFEVYNPLLGRWNILEHPPPSFMEAQMIISDVYGYFVFHNKLYVSTFSYSSCYDVSLDRWETCDILFEEKGFKYWERSCFSYPPGCGHPFPFMRKAIHFKKDIFLCSLTHEFVVGAFRITDCKRAERVRFWHAPMGILYDLVDLGDDCFVVFVIDQRGRRDEDGHRVEEMMTLITFKVHLLDNGELSCSVISRFSYSMGGCGNPSWMPIYSFTL